MWESLSAGIMNLLGTLTTVDTGIAIYDYGKTNIPAYPAITVTPHGGPAVFGDIRRNQRSYIFSIKAYQERLAMGEQQAEATMRALIDSMITLFDANVYLDDLNGYGRLQGMGYCKPIPSDWKYQLGEQIDVRVAEILLECVVIQ
jgi:hypothetical protein